MSAAEAMPDPEPEIFIAAELLVGSFDLLKAGWTREAIRHFMGAGGANHSAEQVDRVMAALSTIECALSLRGQ